MGVACNILRCLLVSATFCYYASGHRCVHDKIVNQTILHKINLEEATKQRSNRAAVRPYGAIRIVTHVVHKYVSKKHRSRLQDKNGPGPIHLATSQIGRVLRVKRIPQLAFPLQCSSWLGSGACLYNHVIPMKCGTSPEFDIPLDHMRQMRVCHDSTETNCTTVGGGGITSADLVVYLTAINHGTCGDSTIAYASNCALDTSNGNRPVAGVINICPKNFWRKTSNKEYQYKVFLHELTHILAFSNQLYPHFVHAQGSSASSVARRSFYNGQEIAKIITPNVVAWGRHFYNCDKLEGVMLHPSNLIGWLSSHWNHLLLEEEYMSPGLTRITGEVKVISNFTFALLQDSGWYQVDFNVTRMWKQPSKFKDAGCSIIESCPMHCPSSENQHTGCSHDGLASAVCNKYSLTMNCSTYQAFSDYSCTDVTSKTLANHNRRYEVLGNQSRCFVLRSTFGPNIVQYGHCLRYQCYQLSHTHLYALKVFLPARSAPYCHGNNNLLTCSKKYKGVWCREGVEMRLPNHYGNITCPRAAHYCTHSSNIMNIENVPPSLCDDSCATCFKPYDPAQCTSCYHGYQLNGNFTANCLPNYIKCLGASYHDNTTNNCKSCPEGCAICSSSTDCKKCSNYSHYLSNQLIAPAKCVASCEEVGLFSYINSTNQRRLCYVCSDVNCVSCDVTGRCNDCRSPYQLYDGSCVLRCPNNMIKINGKCHGCPRHCQQCYSEQQCSRCEPGYQLAAGFCVVKCPSTFYSVNSTHCDECSKGCAYCIRSWNCILCNTGYHSYRQGCVEQCPSGYYISIDLTKWQLYCRACNQSRATFGGCS